MAQNRKPKQGKRAPAYSADGMAVSLIVGLILIALGVLLLLSVTLELDHDIFRLLRTLGCGLGGALAVVLPVVPIWGGALIIVSTQRKPPVRPFLLGTLLMLLVMGIVTLLTFSTSTQSLNDLIQDYNTQIGVGGGMTAALARGYECGAGAFARYPDHCVGGGFLGMLLAWPMWRLMGTGTGVPGEVLAAVLMILLVLVDFCFLIRLDVKGIAESMKLRGADRRARRDQQKLEQQKQELLWQQEQAWQQEQMRLQQEQLRQQQYEQQMMLQQQRVQPAPQRNAPQPEPLDPWSGMMPTGTANWNQTQGRMQPAQPPLVQKVETRPTKAQKPRQKPQVGFQPTPEELGQYSAPQSMPEAQAESAPRKKSLFRRDKAEESADAPRRKGLFSRGDEDEVLPGEATQPAPRRQPAQAAPARPAQPARKQDSAPVKPVIAQPVPEEEDWYANDIPQAPMDDWRSEDSWSTPAEPQPAPVAQEEPPRRHAEPAPKPEQPAAPKTPAQRQEPLAAQTPVREGSFMARLQAAKAAAEGSPAPQTAQASPAAQVTPAAQAAQRKSRKDTPSAWSQPDAPAGNASWRSGEDQRSARPAARNAAAPQKPARAWEDTPPWEDSPDSGELQPAAPVTPVLSRETPQDNMWQPEIKTPPRRQNMAALADGALMETEEERPYIFPSMDLLKDPDPQKGISEEEDALRSRRLENTLQSFRVPAKVRHITHGPAISRFELELAPGVKVSKVTDLNRNIAMNMEVKSVRIEAPIPGKSLVGVEVPNRERATVTLREVLESEPMRKATKPLVVALGKDIAGTPIVCDLAKMPHLLIAGATGSGKSVCINTIINSLLYRCSPKEVRLILVDPKVVELQCYNGIPHLLVPVVSDPHKASGALAWAVGEMMDRYKRFQEAGVRAIDGYNEQMPEDEKMPRIVIVIDELADLMMTCKKDVEERICRLAQLARAAGIHLIVATQRPSVDVITGLIKANIPSRIAFKVSSNVDSRTILDRIGAEQLLGYGDMLYMPTGEFTPIRVQGCFLSDPEVNRITDFIRESCPASYDPAVLEELEKLQSDSDNVVVPDSSGSDDYTGGDGSLLTQCIEMAVNDGQVSTSLIQRRLKLGYARAGRLVDEMEKRGIVSQKDGAKPRMCLISREEFEMMKDSGQLD